MASFGLKYRAHFGSHFGGRMEVHISERDYTGNANLLLFDGQSATQGFVHPTDSPLTVTWGRKGSDIYTPILASHATAQFWKVGDTPLLGDLRGAPPGKFLMEIYHDPAFDPSEGTPTSERYLYWKGRVKTDTYSDSTMTAPGRVDVEATDGLGVLKEAPYHEVTRTIGGYDPDTGNLVGGGGEFTTPFEGRVAFIEHLDRCLSKLPYELPYASSVQWYPVQSQPGAGTGSLITDPLEKMAVASKAFYDEDGDPATCHKVVKQILYNLGAQIFQKEGRWHVIQRELLAGDSFASGVHRNLYDAEANPNGRGTTRGALIFDPQNEDHSRLRGDRTWRPVRGTTSVTYTYGPLDSLAPNGNFQADGQGGVIPQGWDGIEGHAGYRKDGWTADEDTYPQGVPRLFERGTSATGPGGQQETNYVLRTESFFHGDLKDSYEVRKRVVEYGQEARREPDVALPSGAAMNVGADFTPVAGREDDEGWLHETYWSLRVGDYYLKITEPDDQGKHQDAVWVDASTLNESDAEHTNFIREPLENEHNDDGVPIESDNSFFYTTPPHPTGGPITLSLYATSDKDGESGGGFLGIGGSDRELNVAGIDWDNIVLEVADTEGEVLAARKTTATTGGEGTKDTVELLIGEGPTATHEARITWGTGPDAPNATDWKRGSYASGEEPSGTKLGALITSTWLRAQAAPLSNRQEMYRGLTRLEGTPSEGRLWHVGEPLRLSGVPAVGGAGEGTAYFHPSWMAKDLYAGTDKVELCRVLSVGIDVSFEEEAEARDGFDAPPGGGGSGITIGSGALGNVAQALSVLAGRVARKNPLTTTTGPVSGDVSSLPIETIEGGALLRVGDPIVVVSARSARAVEMQVTETPADGAATLSVGQRAAPVTLVEPLPAGSGVYFRHRALLRLVRTHGSRITALENGGGGGDGGGGDGGGDPLPDSAPSWKLKDIN